MSEKLKNESGMDVQNAIKTVFVVNNILGKKSYGNN